jgi:hypothetical protein
MLTKSILGRGETLKPFVQVCVERRLPGTAPRKVGNEKDLPKTSISQSANTRESADWITKEEPLGHLLDLGSFHKNMAIGDRNLLKDDTYR